MLLGDHEWDTGKSRTEAVKVYTAALVPAAEIDLEGMLRVGMHTVQRLLSLDAEHRLQEIDRIEMALLTWLKQQVGAKRTSDAVAIALWPLRVARRITVSPGDGRSLSARQVTNVLREEIFALAGKKN